MPSEPSPLVAADDIARLVGPAASARGQEYSRGDAVTGLDWNAEDGVLSGRVQGSATRPYSCRVRLVPARADFLRPTTAGCDCPVGLNCKHAAALMFESNRRNVRRLAMPARAGDSAEVPAADREQRRESAPTWRTELTPQAPELRRETRTLLGLLFELRELSGRREHRWRGPSVTTAKEPIRADADYRLAVRPVIRSGTGNWVRTGISWGTLGYQQQRLGLDAAQHPWFSQFGALARSTREMFSAQEGDWLYLDDFASPLLWPMLDQADTLGIALVTGKKNTDVRVAGIAEISLDAVTDASGLQLRTELTIDATPVDPAGARVVGDHGVYVATLGPRPTFLLAPTSGPLSEEHRRLLGRPPLAIPASDVDEFLTDFYPRLGRTVRVSGDGLPRLHPPELVLTATFEPEQVLRLDWAWLYDGVQRPLTAGTVDADLRDAHAEATVLTAVTGVIDEPHRRPDASPPQRTTGSAAYPPRTPSPEQPASPRKKTGAGSAPPPDLPTRLVGVDAAEFTAEVLPELQRTPSVRVEIVGERPDYRELTDAPHLTITATESERRDWFDLGVIVTVEGTSVPFAPLFTALSKGHRKLLLVDNSYLSLEHPAFDELKRLIEEAGELAEWETGPRISRYQAELWAEFEDLADETVAAQSWRDAARGLLDAGSIERVPIPSGVEADLRPYQHDGVDWLVFLQRHGLGGILADDMGLGKTLQTLALIAHTRASEPGRSPAGEAPARPFLVVAPTSVVSNWASEAARYTPGLVVRPIVATEKTAKTRDSVRDAADGADIVITSYALFRLDFAAYQGIGWAGLVLDEAQFVKNPSSKAHRCAVELDAPLKIALTGTPIENSLLDLWALFAIVAPGLFPSKRRFTEDYVHPITRGDVPEHAAERTARLRRRIRPLMVRRTKELVAADLPQKQEQALRVDLVPQHRTLYDAYLQRERQKLLGLVEDLDRNRFVVFRSLTLLRMLSLDAGLIDDDYAEIPSAKLDALLHRLDEVAAEGHRAIVFSQFTSFLRLAATRLDAAGVAYEYLDGSTLNRAAVIDRFRTGDAPVFLISLKAGGFGLNLTEADYVFLLDPWWNPATESQAVDRTHRIGQTRPVHVYRMVASDTIEEKVMALRDKKAALFDAVLEDDAVFSSTLTADDIRGLLEE